MNSVNLLGRITRDVEVKYSQAGNAVCSFNVAVDRRYQKAGEEKKTDFINCKAFGKTAELLGKWFAKGSQIGITGEIQTGSYDNAEGKKVYTTDVVVSQVSFAGSKSNSNPDSEPSGNDGEYDPASENDLPF